MNDDDLRMPWRSIAKITAGTAATVGGLLTWVCYAGLRHEREQRRPRWTDANRWER